MRFLFRPTRSRIVGGVALALAERYGLSVAIVRAVTLASIMSNKLSIFIYLLLWFSIPGEKSVLERLRLGSAGQDDPATRFDSLTARLLRRNMGLSGEFAPARIAFMLLAIAVLLQLANIQGNEFYLAHPFWSNVMGYGDQLSSALFYAVLSIAFFAPISKSASALVLHETRFAQLNVDRSNLRSIVGLLSGVGRTLGIETAYLRATTTLAAAFSLGAAGIVYFGLGMALDKRTVPLSHEMPVRESEGPPFRPAIRTAIGVLLVFLALVRIATEFRWYFFNEPFVQAVGMLVIGLLLCYWGFSIGAGQANGRMWLLTGPIIFLLGIYELSTAIFAVALPFTARFEFVFLLVGTAFIYYSAVVATRGSTRKIAATLGVTCYVMALMLQADIIASHYLLLLTQFYDFFHPICYAAAGLWLVMDDQ